MFRKNNTAPKRRLDRSFLSRIRRKTTGILTFTIIIATALIFFSTDTHGATVAWDGGGATNNWSECANWVGDICPTSADVATFDGTSTKDATIDSDITVLGIDINMGYTGTMSMDDVFTITIGSSGYTQDDGIFNAQWATIDINDGSFTLNTGATFDGTGAFIEVERDITLGSGINFTTTGFQITMDGEDTSDDGSLVCGHNFSFSNFNISKTSYGANSTIGYGCSVDIGDDATISGGTVTNNGNLTVGTGTWTMLANFVQSYYLANTDFGGTTIDISVYINYIPNVDLIITDGSFTATSMTTLLAMGDIDNSAGLLPTDLDVILGANYYYHSSNIICNGNENFSSFTINKDSEGAITTLGSNCIIDLGDNPTVSGADLVNNGTLIIGAGTWTLNSSFTQNSAGASTTFSGDSMSVNYKNVWAGGAADLLITDGSFTANSMISLTLKGDLDNSSDLLPYGLDITLDGNYTTLDSNLICSGNENFSSFQINKASYGADVTLGSDCIVDLGNDVTVTAGTFTNNGTLTIGTGDLLMNASFVQSSAGASTAYAGTNMNFNLKGNSSYYEATLTISNGTFTANSMQTLSIKGDLNNSAGLLPAGTDLNIYGDYSTHDAVITCNGNESFSSITVNATSSGAEKKFNGDCVTTGNFSRIDGVVLNSDSASTLTVQGDFNVVNTDAFGGNNLLVKLTGTNSQNLSQTSSSFFSPFEIDKSSGTVTQTGGFSTNGTVCDITSGTLFTNGHGFTCGSTFSIHSFSTLRLIGNESVTDPLLYPNSTVEYKGDGDGLADSYLLKDWGYENLSVNTTDAEDIVTSEDAHIGGLVTYFAMDEVSGSSVADTSGSSNDATATNTTVISGRFTNGRHFDGSGDYLLTTSPANLPSGNVPKSISTWFNYTTCGVSAVIGGFGNNSNGENFQIEACKIGNFRVMGWGTSYDWSTGVSNSSYIDGDWHHVAVTYDGTNTLFYLDGIEKASTSSYTFNTNPQKIVLGDEIDQSGMPFNGSVDDFRIYDDVLTPAEITSLSNGNLNLGQSLTSLSIANNFTLSGGTFVSPATMNVGGYFVNAGGTFDANSGTVVLNGTNQIVSGDNTFNNITKQVASADTLTFGAGTTQTVAGTLTMNGASGQLLSLRSNNVSNQWNIDPQGTRTLDFLDVQDSNNTNALAIDTGSFTYTDSGNNTNWGTAAAVQAIGRVVCVDDQGTWTNTMVGTGANDIKILVSDQSQSYSVTYGQTEVSYPESTYSFNLGSGSNYYDISLDIPEVVELDDGSFINASDLTSIDGYGVATNACPNNYYNQAGAFPSAYADPFFSNYQDPYFCENINESGAWVDGNGDPYAGQCSGDVADSYNNCLITDDPEGVSHLNFYFEGCDTSGKIVNADPEVEVVLQTDETMDVKTVKQVGTKTVRVKKSGKVIVDAPVDFSSTRDWTDVVADTEGNKSVVHFTGNSGHTTTHTIYAPMGSTTEFRACPQATTLGAVNTNCSNGVLFQGPYPEIQTVGVDTVTVTTEEIEGTTYWKASGLSGSGGEGENPPTEKFADGQWTRNTGVDTIIFENTIDMAAGDKILLTWDIGVDLVATTVTDVTVDGTSSIVTTSQTTNTAEIIIPAGGMLAGSHTIVGTFLETYDSETYTAHTVGINTVRSNDESVGYGIAIIYEDNTVDVTAGVPQYLNMTLSKSTIDLGVLSTGAVNRDSHSITVYSNDGNGYTISVKSDGGLTDGTNNITPIPEDGTVVEGLESYGVAVLADAEASELGDFADVGDTPLPSVAKEEIVGNTARASGHIHTITYSASISSSTIAGIYTQTVTYTIASNL